METLDSLVLGVPLAIVDDLRGAFMEHNRSMSMKPRCVPDTGSCAPMNGAHCRSLGIDGGVCPDFVAHLGTSEFCRSLAEFIQRRVPLWVFLFLGTADG
jgi:hypothetical protein